MLYAVRKRRGQWTVCSDEHVVLQFETYDEAVATARGAVAVLASHSRRHPMASGSNHERGKGALDDTSEGVATG